MLRLPHDVDFEHSYFNRVQLAADGRTKGAVYDHFKSKEDLFLALFEARAKSYIEDLVSRLKKCIRGKQSFAAFRQFYVGLTILALAGGIRIHRNADTPLHPTTSRPCHT